MEQPTSWHVLKQNVGEETKEAVFILRCIIVSKDLPPLREKPKWVTAIDAAANGLTEKWQRVSAPRFKYLQQGISLTSLGSAMFANALDAAHKIYNFDRQFAEGILDHWGCSLANNTFPCIDISNRYLTPAREAGGIEETPFHKGVDLNGIIQNMANSKRICFIRAHWG